MANKQAIKIIFLAGLWLRLLVMPWFAHDDIISVHKRVETIVCGSKKLLDYGAVGVHATETVFAKMFSPLIPCKILSGISTNFYDAPHLNRLIFFFKLPYLFFEIGFWILLWQFVKKAPGVWKKRLAVFLAFNPIIFFSIYVFGRFEAYNLFLSALILLLLKKFSRSKLTIAKLLLISLIMAITISVRKSYLFILPALVTALGVFNWKSLLTLGLSGGFYGLLGYFRNQNSVSQLITSESSVLASGKHTNYIFQGAIDIGYGRQLYFFLILLGIIFFWWLKNKRELEKKLKPVGIFSLLAVLIFLSYYATAIFHPQYYSWFIPFFFILILQKKSRFLLKSFYFTLPFFLLLLLSWGNYTCLGLLFPVSPAFRQVDLNQHLPFYSSLRWGNIGGSVLAGLNLYWLYYLLKSYDKTDE